MIDKRPISWYIRDERYIFKDSILWRDDSELEGLPYISLGNDVFTCTLRKEKVYLMEIASFLVCL